MTVNVEVGKYYLDGNGEVHGPMKKSSAGTRYSYIDPRGVGYHANGRYYSGKLSEFDLISECNADGSPIEPPYKDTRSCTCHPDDNPPTPCPKKYTLTDCRKAASTPLAPAIDPQHYALTEEELLSLAEQLALALPAKGISAMDEFDTWPLSVGRAKVAERFFKARLKQAKRHKTWTELEQVCDIALGLLEQPPATAIDHKRYELLEDLAKMVEHYRQTNSKWEDIEKLLNALYVHPRKGKIYIMPEWDTVKNSSTTILQENQYNEIREATAEWEYD